jgi:hypothetical protein
VISTAVDDKPRDVTSPLVNLADAPMMTSSSMPDLWGRIGAERMAPIDE